MIQTPDSTSFAFDSCDIAGQILERYDAERSLVIIVEGILKKDAGQLKTAMQTVAIEQGVSLADLVDQIRSAANGFQSLGELFESAAARIEVVEADLV